MPRKKSDQPTERELEILQVLWRHGGRTVREICQELQQRLGDNAPALTSIHTTLQIAAQKKLVRVDAQRSPAVYYPLVEEATTKRGLLEAFARRVFGVPAKNLVMRGAKRDARATPDELKEMERMIREMKGRDRS